MVTIKYIIIILQLKITIPFCHTMDKYFLVNAPARINMNYKMKYNYN